MNRLEEICSFYAISWPFIDLLYWTVTYII